MPILEISPNEFQIQYSNVFRDVEGSPNFLAVHGEAIVLVLVEEDPLGYALIKFRGVRNERAELDRLFVIEPERRFGRATEIIESVIIQLEKRRCTSIEFYSGHAPDAPAAHRQLKLFSKIFSLLHANAWTNNVQIISVPTEEFVLANL